MNGKENQILAELKEIKARLRDLQADMDKMKEKLNKLSPDAPLRGQFPRKK
jgi:chromosome segregation ATPase